jgi:predicted ATPase/DNA-binding SARP family transcriptional activator
VISAHTEEGSSPGVLHLFKPGFEAEGSFTPLTPERALWLLAYLAVHDHWVARDELTRLLWPDSDPETARGNLRQLVYRTRKMAWAPTLEVERSQLRWRDGSDVHSFRRAYQAGRWEEALASYQGDLLSGFEDFEAEEFSAWLDLERGHLNALWREAAQNQAAQLQQAGRFDEAAKVLERILHSDPLAEDVLCEYLQTARQSGRRDRALELYRNFAKLLNEELGLEPRAETRQLVEVLRSSAATAHTPQPTDNALPPSRLPLSATRFVGRKTELEWLETKLTTPGVQVLSLVGPGGIGKTQLALELVRRFARRGVFVSLVGHDAGRSLAPAVAEALGLVLPGQVEAESELKGLLEGQTLLVVLDNVEQVIEEARLLATRLEALGGVQLLFTSRVRLGLANEHSLEVGGLNFPSPGEALRVAAESYDAVRLLLETMRRVNPDAEQSSAEQAEAVRICQGVAGVPLALVLAGSWARLLTLAEIADELEKNLDFLAGSVRGLPERHGGMRAVFEHSWNLLSEAQREVLAGLSVFRGGFDRSTASAVTGASNLVLLELLDSSLLRRVGGETNRFDLHELVRQYAQEKLETGLHHAATVRQKHAEWFLTWTEGIKLRKQKGLELAHWMRRVEQDYDNLRAVFAWAEREGQTETTVRLARPLQPFWRARGYSNEGRGWLKRALNQLGSLRGTALHAIALAEIGELSRNLGDMGTCAAAHHEALDIARAADDYDSLTYALNGLAIVAYNQGDYALAHQHYEEVLALAQQQGDMAFVARVLYNIALTYHNEGDLQAALQNYQESLALRTESGDTFLHAFTLRALGDLSHHFGDHVAAQHYLEQSLELAIAIGDRDLILGTHVMLGKLAFHQANYGAAHAYFRQALHTSRLNQYHDNVPGLLEGIAALIATVGQHQVAAKLLGQAEVLRETSQILRDPHSAVAHQACVEIVKKVMGDVAFSVAWREGRTLSLEPALALALEALDKANLRL